MEAPSIGGIRVKQGDGQKEHRYEEYTSSPYPPTYEGGGYGGGYKESKYDAAANAPYPPSW